MILSGINAHGTCWFKGDYAWSAWTFDALFSLFTIASIGFLLYSATKEASMSNVRIYVSYIVKYIGVSGSSVASISSHCDLLHSLVDLELHLSCFDYSTETGTLLAQCNSGITYYCCCIVIAV